MSASATSDLGPDLGEDRLREAGDDFYELLISAHQGLSFEESAALNARLVLILANLVADPHILSQAIAAARKPTV